LETKKILKYNSLDTVFIGIGPQSFSGFNDLKFSDIRWAETMFKRAYAIQDFSNVKPHISYKRTPYLKVLWKETAFYPKKEHFYFLGNYSNRNEVNLTNLKSRIKRQYYLKGEQVGISKLSINYLDSILNLSLKNKTVPIIIGCPVHEIYFQKIPSQNIAVFDSVINTHSKNYITLDFTNKKYSDSLFLDVDHLNRQGAKVFTHQLKEVLNELR